MHDVEFLALEKFGLAVLSERQLQRYPWAAYVSTHNVYYVKYDIMLHMLMSSLKP
ncbi:hypothetical protein C4J97_2688 [Pseudomonas orientalis]|nr:hypothetical protein C4J97_2688 [Pseudomonas orientalis]